MDRMRVASPADARVRQIAPAVADGLSRPEPSAGEPTVWIDTDNVGYIVDCHPGALDLIGCSARTATHQRLPFMFIVGRPQRADLELASRGDVIQIHGVIRPPERRGISIDCRIEAAPNYSSDRAILRWTFTRLTDSSGAA